MNKALPLRRFTTGGIDAFRGYLGRLRDGETAPPPNDLLEDGARTETVHGDTVVEPRPFASRLDFAKYADRILAGSQPNRVLNDVGLWAWLSLYYFDQVCPPGKSGARHPGRNYRHIPEPGFRYGRRHLLSGAYLVYTIYGLSDRLAEYLLYTALPVESDLFNEIVSRQNLVTNPVVVEATGRLYFDPVSRKPRRGVFQRTTAGNTRRFAMVIQQLDLNYDLYSMTCDELLGLLPPEFDRWK